MAMAVPDGFGSRSSWVVCIRCSSICPVENMVYSNQQQYYDAIGKSTRRADSGPFIDFMLGEILKTLKSHQGEPLHDNPQDKLHDKMHDKLHDKFPELSKKAFEVLGVLEEHPHLKAEEIGAKVSLSERQVKTYLNALKQAGLIIRVGSNKTGYWKVETL